MPLRLYAHLAAELLRVMALTTGILVTVIAFGAAIKPLAQNLLGPSQTLLFISLAMVPMLQFALPFAAGFAATIVFHRFTVENEIMAMTASGLSYRRILAPVGLIGFVLAIVMVLLGQWIIPRFNQHLESIISRNVMKLLSAAVQNRQALTLDNNMQIYADRLYPRPVPEGSQAYMRLLLTGVAAVQLDAEDRPQLEFTSEFATIDVYRRSEGTYLKLALGPSASFSAESGVLASAPVATPDAIRLTGDLEDSSKFWTWAHMQRILADPDLSVAVQEKKTNLAAALNELQVWKAIEAGLRREGRIELQDPSGQRRFLIRADAIEGGKLVRDDGGEIEITVFNAGLASRRAAISMATIEVAPTDRDGQVNIVLVSEAREVVDMQSGIRDVGRWEERRIDLRLVAPPPPVPAGASSQALLDLVAATEWSSVPNGDAWRSRIEELARLVRKEIAEDRHDMAGRFAARFALATTAPLLLLLGAILSIWLRGSSPLQVYLLAFLPSILDIVLISSGEQMMRKGSLLAGPAVMWLGNAVLLTGLILTYRRLARN